MKDGFGWTAYVEGRVCSRPRLCCVDALVTAQQSLEQGAARERALTASPCCSPVVAEDCFAEASSLPAGSCLSLSAASVLFVRQCSASSLVPAAGAACGFCEPPCASLASPMPQSFSSSFFFRVLNRAPLQAPVAQPPSAPAQQGIEQECAAERTANGMALDKSASVRSAAERVRKRGRVWRDAKSKGEFRPLPFRDSRNA
jgi:hypothetical protein